MCEAPSIPGITLTTCLGTICTSPEGLLQVSGVPDEIEKWMFKARWVCSTLIECDGEVVAIYAPNGDLIHLEHPGVDDIPANELLAWTQYVLGEVGLCHPAIDR